MIKEDYVSLETAKLLKEKGFDEKCMSYYGHGEFQLGHPEYMKSNTDRDGVACNGVPYDAYNAPTLQMAMKWLREEHGLFIGLVYQRECLSKADKWFWKWNISNKHNKFAFVEFGESDSYEEACEVAIKYCLEKLI